MRVVLHVKRFFAIRHKRLLTAMRGISHHCPTNDSEAMSPSPRNRPIRGLTNDSFYERQWFSSHRNELGIYESRTANPGHIRSWSVSPTAVFAARI